MSYTTADKIFNNYPLEFGELSINQEVEARAEFDQVVELEQLVKNELQITNQ